MLFSMPKKWDDPYCMNVAGASHSIANLSVDWSLGEAPISHTLQAPPGYILSTGFLQSKNDPLLLFKNLDSFSLQIKVGPNPFTHIIQIAAHQEGVQIHAIQLFNSQGIILHQMKGQYAGLHFNYQIHTEALNNSICYLVVNYSIGDFLFKSKCFKLIQNNL